MVNKIEHTDVKYISSGCVSIHTLYFLDKFQRWVHAIFVWSVPIYISW